MEFATADNPETKKEICLVTKPRYGHNQEICLCSNELNFLLCRKTFRIHIEYHML